jgi:CBS domain-containing protein
VPSIRPSPALIVTSDTPIDDCVRKMRDHDVGSLLVVSYQRPYPLVGIFTERDLMRKFDEIQSGGHWSKAVGVVMKKPVVTVGITELEDAPAIMLQNGFRHLPVVYEDEEGETHVAGVISMRDVFRYLVEKDKAELKLPRRKLRVGLLAGKDERFEAFRNVFETKNRGTVERLTSEGLADRARRVEFIVVDLDGLPPKDWALALKAVEETKSRAFVLFSPAEHSPDTVKTLQKLAKTERYAPFAKPVNVLELLAQLNRWRGRA